MNNKIHSQANEKLASEPYQEADGRPSMVRLMLTEIKKLVQNYREGTRDQVYMSSNFKLDN